MDREELIKELRIIIERQAEAIEAVLQAVGRNTVPVWLEGPLIRLWESINQE